MAENLDSGSGDWTAGIVAIVAALLLGGGVPVGLYFGLYEPKVKEREAAEAQLQSLQSDQDLLLARQERVRGIEEERDDMIERVAALEARFTMPDATDTADQDLKVIRGVLAELADQHHLSLMRGRAQNRELEIVKPAGQRVTFENGLSATGITIEAQATYHDFGRFMAAIEGLPDAVVIPAELICTGDASRGTQHAFILTVYVVEQRDIDAIGR